MNSEEKYKNLAERFDLWNSKIDSGDDLNASPEEKKLEFFWEECMPEDIDPTGIIVKTEAKITAELLSRKKQRLFLRLGSIAASILLVISVSLYIYKPNDNAVLADLRAIGEKMDSISTDQVTLITSESQLTVDEDSKIKYSVNGNIAINSTTIKNVNTQKTGNDDQIEYNQLIVPAGKRTCIQLSDGTLMWINSNTKVVYPRVFKGATRSIFVQGEAYLEVAHDKSHPFIVTANGFDLKVLGTKFNITNYERLRETNIVLVEGSVEVKDKSNRISTLSPNDLLEIRNGAISQQRKVDTNVYTSWIYGTLNLNGDKLLDITKKLELYFGVSIKCLPAVENEKVYGKLDLKDNLEDILECLKFTLPIETENINNEIILKENTSK